MPIQTYDSMQLYSVLGYCCHFYSKFSLRLWTLKTVNESVGAHRYQKSRRATIYSQSVLVIGSVEKIVQKTRDV